MSDVAAQPRKHGGEAPVGQPTPPSQFRVRRCAALGSCTLDKTRALQIRGGCTLSQASAVARRQGGVSHARSVERRLRRRAVRLNQSINTKARSFEYCWCCGLPAVCAVVSVPAAVPLSRSHSHSIRPTLMGFCMHRSLRDLLSCRSCPSG